AAKKEQVKAISQSVNNIISGIEADITLQVNKINAGRFKASQLGGNVSVSGDFVKFNNVSMQTSDGLFSLNGGITSLSKAPYSMNISSNISNADISSLFYSFDNFQQKTITHQNLKGRLTALINFSAQLKKDYDILPQSMNGKVVLKIRNGGLIDLKSIQEISRHVFKNRDFDDIEFALLQDTMTIKAQDIQLSRMEIQSSVLSLFVEGTYSFAGNTDISIQIPLSNLKKRDEDYKPENVGVDAKLGPSIFLRAMDDDSGSLVITF